MGGGSCEAQGGSSEGANTTHRGGEQEGVRTGSAETTSGVILIWDGIVCDRMCWGGMGCDAM